MKMTENGSGLPVRRSLDEQNWGDLTALCASRTNPKTHPLYPQAAGPQGVRFRKFIRDAKCGHPKTQKTKPLFPPFHGP